MAPIAEMYLDGVLKDERFLGHFLAVRRPEPPPDDYFQHGQKIMRMMIRSRLDNKLVLTARLLDPAFDARVRAVCPELPELTP